MNGLALKPQHEEPSNKLQTFEERFPESKEITYLAWSKGLIFREENSRNQIAAAGASHSVLSKLLVGMAGTAEFCLLCHHYLVKLRNMRNCYFVFWEVRKNCCLLGP